MPRWHEKDWEECDNASLRLCGFSDASTKAYEAVVYLVRCFDGEKRSVLIASKSRVAPNSQLTVPRLELMGALLLARLIDSIRKALKLDVELLPSLFYSDSQLGENKEWKPFAQNRVQIIRSLVPANNWKFCPGKDNPADLPSRGASVSELLTKFILFQGPEWIGTKLIENISSEMPTECMQELHASDRTCSLLVSDKSLKQVIDLKRYSNLIQLCRVTALVFMFISRARRKEQGLFLSQWMIRAEELWVMECQKDQKECHWIRNSKIGSINFICFKTIEEFGDAVEGCIMQTYHIMHYIRFYYPVHITSLSWLYVELTLELVIME